MRDIDRLIELGKYWKKHRITLRQFHFNFTEEETRNETKYIEKSQQPNFFRPCKMYLDQSTQTGFAIFDSRNHLVTAGEFNKSVKTNTDRYRFALKEFLNLLIDMYSIEHIFYEEVYDSVSPKVTETLNNIKLTVKDIELERIFNSEDNKSKIEVLGVDHAVWKSELAKPHKFKRTKNDKEEVLKHIERFYPLLVLDMPDGKYLEHMFDSIGMGIGLQVNQGLSTDIYDNVRYHKKLPIVQNIFKLDELPNLEDSEKVNDFVSTLNKPFRDAYNYGGLKVFTIKDKEQRKTDELIKRYLSYKDSLHLLVFDNNYSHYGLTHLFLNNSLKNEDKDQKWCIISARQNRIY